MNSQISYFNSSLPTEVYKKVKIEAIKLNITVKEHLSNIIKNYIEEKEDESTNKK